MSPSAAADRWTIEIEDLVATTTGDAYCCAPWPPSNESELEAAIEAGHLPEDYDVEAANREAMRSVAREILTVLADAGLLRLPSEVQS